LDREFGLNDIVKTRKKHPCGSDLWQVIRVGADIKIKCQGCGRIVMLARRDFVKRLKQVVRKDLYEAQSSPEGTENIHE